MAPYVFASEIDPTVEQRFAADSASDLFLRFIEIDFKIALPEEVG
jgi:hypothetical protein